MPRILPVVLSMCIAVTGCYGPDPVVDVRTIIRHDDFDYSVQSVKRPALVDGRAAQGQFVVVTFQVENHARRVNHLWSDDIAYVVDDRERTYEGRRVDGGAERSATTPGQHVTRPGEIEMTTLVFDVPKDAGAAYLKVRGETLMGDVLNGRRFARTRVKLL